MESLTKIGPYDVIGKLGEGGTAVVWKVQDPRTKKTYALKVMTKQLSLRRFKRELRAMSRLSHPNIVGVYDHGVLGENPYFTMEYIQGCDLKQFIRTKMPTKNGQRWRPTSEADLRRVCEIVTDIARPLEYVHRQKIIHRDIKPANVMLSEQGVTKLMDFGLVKEMDVQFDITLTKTGVFVGTVAYMSPEQGMGKPVDARSDLYSLGVILYELLAGRLPFTGTNLVAVILKHIKEPPAPPSTMNPLVPPALDAIALKLLSKAPGDRYESAAALIEALRYFMTCPADAGPVQATEAILEPEVGETYVLTQDKLYQPGFVGRARQLALLRAQIDSALAGSGGLVMISGEPGIGKTRLIEEIADHARLKRVRLMRGSCQEIERYPFQAFLGILEQIVERLKGMDPEDALRILGPQGRVLERICPRFSELPFMNRLPEVVALEPMQDKLRSIDTVRNLLERMSDNHTMLLVVDDLQWADELSLELLAYLSRNLLSPSHDAAVREAGGGAVLVLGAYRDDEVHGGHPLQRLITDLSRQNLVRKVPLERLTRDQLVQMIESMTGVPGWPDVFVDLLFSEAEGNPLFTEEILRAYVDEGVIRRQSGEWQFQVEEMSLASMASSRGILDSKLIKIPPAIFDIVARRLDRLSPESKKVLSRAAIIGRKFEFEILAGILDMDEDALLDIIDELMRNDVIVEATVKGGEELFAFQHDMIRIILSGEIGQSRLRRIHRAVGEAIEEIHRRDPSEHLEALAHHFHTAGIQEKALRYLHRAGEKARRGYVNAVALNYYRLALEVADKMEPSPEVQRIRFDLYSGRSKVLTLMGNLVKALEDRREMLSLAEAMGNRKMVSEAYRHVGAAQLWVGELDQAKDSFLKALDIATEDQDQDSEVEAVDFVGSIHRLKGEFSQALTCYERSMAISRELQNPGGEARSLMNIGIVHYSQSRYDEALQNYERSLAILRELNDKAEMIKGLNNIGNVHYSKGNFNEAVRWYSEFLEIAKEIGDRHGQAAILSNLGLVYFLRGEYGAATNCFLEAVDVTREIGDKVGEACGQHNLGLNRMHQGAGRDALPQFHQSLALAREVGDRYLEAHNLFYIGDLHLRLGEAEMARKYYEDAAALAQEIKLAQIEVLAAAGRGLVLAEFGAVDEGLRIVREAIGKALAIEDVDGIMRSTLTEVRLLLMRGSFVDAQSLIGPLILRARSMGLQAYLWQARQLMGRALLARGRREASYSSFKSAADTVVTMADDCEDEYREQFLLQSEIQTLLAEVEAVCRLLGRTQEAGLYRKLLRS